MKIRYENTVDDMAALTQHAMDRLPFYRVFSILLLFCPAALFLIAGLLGLVMENDLGCLAMGLAFGVGWPALLWLLLRFLPGFNTRLMMRGGRNSGIVCWHELELADGTLIERTDVNTTTAALRAVEKIVSDETYTLVYTSTVSAHVIPRRSVPEQEYRTFVDALRREWEQAQKN